MIRVVAGLKHIISILFSPLVVTIFPSIKVEWCLGRLFLTRALIEHYHVSIHCTSCCVLCVQVLLPPQAHSSSPDLHNGWAHRHQTNVTYPLGQSWLQLHLKMAQVVSHFYTDWSKVWAGEWGWLKGQTGFCSICSSTKKFRYMFHNFVFRRGNIVTWSHTAAVP